MMLPKTTTVLAATLGVVAVTASPHAVDVRTLHQRWSYDVCNNCSLYGIPAPDKDTFNDGPIDGYHAGRTYDLCLGSPPDCSAKWTVRLDFVGLNLFFNFSNPPAGYKYAYAGMFLAPMGVGYGPTFKPPPSDVTPTYHCTVNADGSATCAVPFCVLTGKSSTDAAVLFNAMCPLGSKQALDFYVAFSGSVSNSVGTYSFKQKYPCTSFSSGTCTSYCTTCIYAEMSYRCTKCNIPCPSSTTSSIRTSSTSSSSTSSSTSTSSTPTTSSTSSISSSSSTSSTSSSTSSTSSSGTSSTSTSESSTLSSTSSTTSSSSTSSISTSSTSTSSTSTSSSSASSDTSSSASSTTSSTSTSSTSPTSTSSSTATPTTCDYGTAFGYQNSARSQTLNSQNPLPRGCNRWGWYETPSSADLAAGIGGTLYVGAGGNDLSKATDVGTWSAVLSGGLVAVTYTATAPYTLAEVHVDLDCLPMDTCAPGQYTYGHTFSGSGASSVTTPGIAFPACGPGGTPYLTIHAKVLVSTTATTCAPPAAT